ncbi:hypothetical protein GUITHDRAFT_149590 [Guillardia theta CCMP2712]|uniref:Uncharacterized protein n=1 Tax=Guillardia theta (strain CCMP2712) TaxID=905079 RepID=L1I4F8_GUITC|nr:hypothetical protein GUITHDRAFT_149590 [Guillardia theta CCMP2712]EKX30962.1 hypothetical protein GUITHDRAFT_149590 [Guillardia theta CCMP2712]|eukprot:XP_005817942.1 hypothetical protein GUITHDRAFT_149590 [Guillardia theta CCMP2712]
MRWFTVASKHLSPPHSSRLLPSPPPSLPSEPRARRSLRPELVLKIYGEKASITGPKSLESAFIGRMHGVSGKTVRDIWDGKTWSHVTGEIARVEAAKEAGPGDQLGEPGRSLEVEERADGERREKLAEEEGGDGTGRSRHYPGAMGEEQGKPRKRGRRGDGRGGEGEGRAAAKVKEEQEEEQGTRTGSSHGRKDPEDVWKREKRREDLEDVWKREERRCEEGASWMSQQDQVGTNQELEDLEGEMSRCEEEGEQMASVVTGTEGEGMSPDWLEQLSPGLIWSYMGRQED